MEENGGDSNKKIQIEDLSKEELIKRCKHYLVLAQKAKIAKEESGQREHILQQRIIELESKLSQDDLTKNAHQSSDLITDDQLQLNNAIHSLQEKGEANLVLNSQIADMENQMKNMKDAFVQQKNGFIEELNKMNVILKQRGEAITTLEEQCLNAGNDLKVQVENLKLALADKDKKIDQLENEVNRLETQSEAMSTSTVSKAEEIHRMKDVEDSLEDRYNKLKMLAVKMKKKMAEQNLQLNNRINPLNMQALQKDIDRLNDELDAKKSEISVLKKDCDNSITELVNSRQRAEEFKNENASLKASYANLEKVKKSFETSIDHLENQIETDKKEQEADKFLRLEFSKECDRLKNEILVLKSEIDELNKANQIALNDAKKQNILHLELSDFERTVSELNSELSSLKVQFKGKDAVIESLISEKDSFIAQYKDMDEKIKWKEEKIYHLETNLRESQFQCNTFQEDNQRNETKIKQLTNESENKGNEIERLKLEVSIVNADLQKLRTESNYHQDSLHKQTLVLESRISIEETEKKNLVAQLSELRLDYENYKTRAVSAFKKKKAEGSGPSPSNNEPSESFSTDQVEREMLQRLVDALKLKVTQLESSLSLSSNEVSSLHAEKERLISQELKTKQFLEERVKEVEKEKETLKREHFAVINQLHSDNQLLAALHRDQIDSLKLQHTQELLDLQNQLDLTDAELSKLQKTVSSKTMNKSISPLLINNKTLANELYHQDGTSEWDDALNHSPSNQSEDAHEKSHKPMPLDLLLNSALIPDETETQQFVNETVSVGQLNNSLLISEKRCRHLAALLAESEANEVRLSQLTEALKEEIRRNERAEERQKHVENLEYLKNIVLKFMTLPRGEEKSRLVPVLTTLLRLSPMEVQEVHQTLSRSFETPPRPTAWGGVFNLWAQNP